MKTQNTTLEFTKHSVIELNHNDLLDINGGSTPTAAAASTGGCAAGLAAAGAAIGAGIAWLLAD